MTDQMKYIVKELNATLGRNYDLIKFDSLNEKQLLQLLVDLLVNFNAGEKLDINEDDTETVSVSLLEMLGSVKYRPPAGIEPSRFRAQLLAGDAQTIHHVLHWLLSNKEQVKNTAYLANESQTHSHRVTYAQLERLLQFLNANKDIAMGFNKSTQAREYARRMWLKVAKELNSMHEGAIKDARGWSKYWVDYKSKLKKTATKILEEDSDKWTDVSKLTEIEIKYLQMLGDESSPQKPPPVKKSYKEENANPVARIVIEEEKQKVKQQSQPEVACDPLSSHAIKAESSLSELSTPVPSPAHLIDVEAAPGPAPIRRRSRRRVASRPPLSQEQARRALVGASERRLEIEEERNTILDSRLEQLIHAVQELSELVRSRYLKIPEIPNDVARNNTVQDLLDLYQNLIDEFKDVHKRTRMLQKENASEIINDIKEMAVERDIVIKRLENVQINLVDVSNKEELLNVSKALRIQQEKAKELENQYETQQSQLKLASDQLKRYLNVIHGQSAAPKNVNDVIKHLQEEIQLNSYLVKEKLPQESSLLQKELNIMQMIATEQHPSRSDLLTVQDKIAVVNGEMEQLVQRKLATSGPQEDKLAPFRQQAAVIRRNKDASAAKVHELAATLKEHEGTLADLQSQVRQLLGDTVLRGEELKKYVNSLRTKSTIYKRQRANLSTFKVEAGILARTIQIVSTSDPTVEMALVNHKKLKIDEVDAIEKDNDKVADLSKKSLHDLSQLVAQTAQKLSQVRQEIQPLADKIKPVKEEFQTVQQQYEQKKRVYEATSINITSQMEPIKNQVKELTDQLNSKEDEWKNLRQKITKAESLQEVVMFEMKNSMQSPRKPSKMEALKKKVADLEQIVKNLEEEQRAISSRQGAVEEQTQYWENTLRLLRCKMRSRTEPAARQGRMHITHKTQMLTLT